MQRINRRNLLHHAGLLQCRGQPSYTLVVRQIMIVWAEGTNELSGDQLAVEDTNTEKGNTMQIHYLEIVTPDVDASVALYSKIHGISFGAADESLGGARTAKLANGGTLGIELHCEIPSPRWCVLTSLSMILRQPSPLQANPAQKSQCSQLRSQDAVNSPF